MDRDWVDDLVDQQLLKDRGPAWYDGSCPNPKCYASWHGIPTPSCPGSHLIMIDTPV